MAISNLVLTQQIYSEETNGAHAHYREPVPLSAAYVGYLFLQNHRALLYLQLSSLKCSLLFLGLVTESLDHTRLISARPKV